MPDHPLAEVFGFPIDNHSKEAIRHRKHKLCPYNNKVANCTKDKANAPLGVCSIFEQGGSATITCPIRFRQNWIIAEDASEFFFPPDANWTSLTEVRLNDANGKSAGNIDIVLVSYDNNGRLLDFGSLEIQAVYISGNIRNPFEYYMKSPEKQDHMEWKGPNYPHPDYLSSSRKRLVPQLLFKGGILHSWDKKSAVALTQSFFNTLPPLKNVSVEEAEIAWFIYDLELDESENKFYLIRKPTVYSRFKDSMEIISRPIAGELNNFVDRLQMKLDEHLDGEGNNPPDAPTLDQLL